MDVKREIKKRLFGALCLLTLFIMYQVVVATTTHVHYDNGVTITHSHPFQGNHSHSSTSLSKIGYSETTYTITPVAQLVQRPLCPLLAVLKAATTTPTPKGKLVRGISLRAPPVA